MASDVNSRRAARQKKTRQRQLKILLIFFIVIAIVTLVIMCFTVFFQVKVIKSTGSKIYSGSQIGEASKVTGKDSLFFVSEEEIEEMEEEVQETVETKPVEVKNESDEEVLDDDNLFDLIDSMYQEND